MPAINYFILFEFSFSLAGSIGFVLAQHNSIYTGEFTLYVNAYFWQSNRLKRFHLSQHVFSVFNKSESQQILVNVTH